MPLRAVIAILLMLTATTLAVQIRVATFNVGATYGETFFIYGLGAPGTPDHQSVRAILQRMDADVVALQEIHTADLAGIPNDLQILADSLGYPYLYVAPTTNTFDTTFQTVFLSRFPFHSTFAINSPAGAKEITRLHPAVKVDVPGTDKDPVIVSAHLKAGTSLDGPLPPRGGNAAAHRLPDIIGSHR
jgi:endonuclease/exonuclease/phosphatase family metal-dependent hydrolase